MPTKVFQYKACDGKLFDSAQEATTHEANIKAITKLQGILGMSPEHVTPTKVITTLLIDNAPAVSDILRERQRSLPKSKKKKVVVSANNVPIIDSNMPFVNVAIPKPRHTR